MGDRVHAARGRTVTCEARSGGFAFGRGSRMFVTDDAERDRTFERSCKKCRDVRYRFSYVTPFDETMHIFRRLGEPRLPTALTAPSVRSDTHSHITPPRLDQISSSHSHGNPRTVFM